MANSSTPAKLDEIDWEILQLLSSDPRRPYSDISNELQTRGYEMSSEGIRYRVDKILDTMSIFFMLHPNEQDWEVMIMLINVVDGAGAKESVIERVLEDKAWFVSRGFGSFDIYAIVTAATTEDIEQVLTRVRSYEEVDNVEYLIETYRKLEGSNYFPLRNLD